MKLFAPAFLMAIMAAGFHQGAVTGNLDDFDKVDILKRFLKSYLESRENSIDGEKVNELSKKELGVSAAMEVSPEKLTDLSKKGLDNEKLADLSKKGLGNEKLADLSKKGLDTEKASDLSEEESESPVSVSVSVLSKKELETKKERDLTKNRLEAEPEKVSDLSKKELEAGTVSDLSKKELEAKLSSDLSKKELEAPVAKAGTSDKLRSARKVNVLELLKRLLTEYFGKLGGSLEKESDLSKKELETDTVRDLSRQGPEAETESDLSKKELEADTVSNPSKKELEAPVAEVSTSDKLLSRRKVKVLEILKRLLTEYSGKLDGSLEKENDLSKKELVAEAEKVSGLSKTGLEAETVSDLSKKELEPDKVSDMSKKELEADTASDLSKKELEAPVADAATSDKLLSPRKVNALELLKRLLTDYSGKLDGSLEKEGDLSKKGLETDTVSDISRKELEAETVSDPSKTELEAEKVSDLSKKELEADTVSDLSSKDLEAETVSDLSKKDLEAETVGDLSKKELETETVGDLSKNGIFLFDNMAHFKRYLKAYLKLGENSVNVDKLNELSKKGLEVSAAAEESSDKERDLYKKEFEDQEKLSVTSDKLVSPDKDDSLELFKRKLQEYLES